MKLDDERYDDHDKVDEEDDDDDDDDDDNENDAFVSLKGEPFYTSTEN